MSCQVRSNAKETISQAAAGQDPKKFLRGLGVGARFKIDPVSAHCDSPPRAGIDFFLALKKGEASWRSPVAFNFQSEPFRSETSEA